ncbi:predicted protein [Uncinocarpus reesii 1704]|uniref:Uncharacterized protein n=1 Tax=Uncinocarpus reesii (strain UAMH 1704) TaxID=336963 RepID=C4JPB0_UNCRE|nr:uncharacterized protein UREG_04492 [Uncinocarpus reesii 1704]EEP79646.1 predicted protein [Uncinocarpus reesii 1704]
MSNESHRQGQLPPPPWTAGQPDYPQYPAAPTQPPPPYTQYPPPLPPPGMATVQHHVQHPPPDAYRLSHPPPYPHPPEMYAPPAAPPAPPVVYPTAAPRQRTAIACRYCRRRKTQAFVPAHTAYPHLRNIQATARMQGIPAGGVMLYGAHGQPLSTAPAPPPHGQENALPPVMMYQQPQPPYGKPVSGPPGPPASTPSMAHPPMVHDPRAPQGQRDSGPGYDYSEPPTLPPVSVATSGAAYLPAGQDTRRLSSHSSYSFDQSHNPPPGANPSAPTLPYPTLQPLPQPSTESRQTPPPGQASAARRSGLSVTDMLVPAENTRSDTDNRMVSALDRRGLGR